MTNRVYSGSLHTFSFTVLFYRKYCVVNELYEFMQYAGTDFLVYSIYVSVQFLEFT